MVVHNGVSDEEYAELLESAHALVTASRAEGYGLPVVEAQAAGCPAVISDIDIFREIAPHAVFAPVTEDPRADASAWVEAVRSLEDDAVRDRVIPQRLAGCLTLFLAGFGVEAGEGVLKGTIN